MTGTFVITAEGKTLDATTARKLLLAAIDALRDAPRRVLIDLSQVDFIDSLGVSVLVAIADRAPPDVQIALVGLTQYVRTVARMARLDTILPTFETLEEGLETKQA